MSKAFWNFWNFAGWTTSRKIIIIESDDWGTIRMASKNSFDYFKRSGFPVESCAYNTNDALECNEDLEYLFDLLSTFRDKNGKPPVITANNIVANPDFRAIYESDFEQYHYEPFTKTLASYPKHDRVLELYKNGILDGLFKPQFHGREHLNIGKWMSALRAKDKSALMAFENRMFSVHGESPLPDENEYMDAFNASSDIAAESHSSVIESGLRLFRELWGFQSKSFISPCYIWGDNLEESLKKFGVKYIQGMPVQLIPTETSAKRRYKKQYHFQGQNNRRGQVYLVRNAFFEPSTNRSFNWVDDCLHRISRAFKMRAPAIISSHRLNYVGFINPENRERNLELLRELLRRITTKWPDVEFMTSDQLGDLIAQKLI